MIPIRGLFEAHLTVRDLDRSIAFYRDMLGLPLAHVIPERQVAFFWVPSSGQGNARALVHRHLALADAPAHRLRRRAG